MKLVKVIKFLMMNIKVKINNKRVMKLLLQKMTRKIKIIKIKLEKTNLQIINNNKYNSKVMANIINLWKKIKIKKKMFK